MPTQQTVTVYQFDELDDQAKERAREWYRGGLDDYDWAEFVVDDFVQIADILGVTIDTRPVQLMGGGTRQEPCIHWSGFYHQGAGASFTGTYRYHKQSPKRIRHHAPGDTELHRIADTLSAIQQPYQYGLTARIVRTSHHYTHEHTVRVDVEPPEHWTAKRVERDDWRAIEADIAEALRDLMRWFYRALEREYEYQRSDEQVDEAIRANEYEFDEDGCRWTPPRRRRAG